MTMVAKKAQVAVEFVYLVGFALLMLVMFAGAAAHQMSSLRGDKELLLLKDLTYRARTEVTAATEVQDGYSRSFELPADLDGFDYTIKIANDTIITETARIEFFLTIPHVTGNLAKGSNTIRKRGGAVYINS